MYVCVLFLEKGERERETCGDENKALELNEMSFQRSSNGDCERRGGR